MEGIIIFLEKQTSPQLAKLPWLKVKITNHYYDVEMVNRVELQFKQCLLIAE